DELGISRDAFVIVNPRRMAPYVAQENFFAAVAEVAPRHPNVVFLGVAMEGHELARKWARRYGVQDAVRLLPAVDRVGMARLFRHSDVVISLGNHDGTPNTLLEGIACGCFPVVGAIDSVLEWVVDGVNGVTCDQRDPHSI